MSKKITTLERSSKSTQREIELQDSKKFMSPLDENISDSEQVFHNIVMRLTDHSAMGDALWFEVGEDLCRFSINEFCLITGMNCVGSTHLPVGESQLITRYFSTLRGVSRENLELQLSNANFDNDDDAVKLSLLYLIFCIPLSNANSVKIDPKFFSLADNIADFNNFPWGVLSWEATRSAICNAVENRPSPSMALRFTNKYDHAIPRMRSWTTANNVKFDDVMSAFTEVGNQPKGFVMMPTEEELKDPWVACLYLKNPPVVPNLPPKTSVPRPSSDTNSEWREFQKEIRGEGQGEAHTTFHVSSSPKTNVHTPDSDALKTTPPHIGTGSQDDVTIDSDIGAVADMGVKAAIEFLTADKVIVSREDVKDENNEENITVGVEDVEGEAKGKTDPSIRIKEEILSDSENLSEVEKDDKEQKREVDVKQLEEPASEDSIGDMIPKKKRARLSRLGQRPSGSITHVGSPSKAPNKLIYALPPGLDDEPPKEILEEFRRYIMFSKRPARYSAKHDTLDKPHDLGCMMVEKKSWYYELATSPVWLWDEYETVKDQPCIQQFMHLDTLGWSGQ
ncbi:hypothetical protein TIFTF001_050022, partial [Ficus carica]